MDDFARAFVAFFAIIDPIGNIVVFHLFTQGMVARDRIATALIAILTALAMLLVFSLGGDAVLEFLGISREGFQIGAGILLLPPAYRLVMEGEPFSPAAGNGRRPLDLGLVPLAMPLLAGPGALAAAISYSNSLGEAPTIGAIVAVLAVSLAGFLAARHLFEVVGEAVLTLLARLVGLLLFTIAVDFILDGARDFFA